MLQKCCKASCFIKQCLRQRLALHKTESVQNLMLQFYENLFCTSQQHNCKLHKDEQQQAVAVAKQSEGSRYGKLPKTGISFFN